jgi:hypothetical protein
MRRMRGNFSSVFLFAFPVIVGASVGIFYWMEKKQGPSHHGAAAMKERADSGGAGRKIASGHGSGHGAASEDLDDGNPAREADPAKARETARLAKERLEEIERGLKTYGSIQEGDTCGSFEYFGRGESHPAPAQEDWDEVMRVFRGIKADYKAFLVKHKWNMPDPVLEAMQERMAGLRIQRPPAKEEPDLAWRGVAVLTRDPEGRPLVRLGAGFPKLVKERRTRARFELARVMAQVWAPCELAAIKIESPWDPLLRCMKMNDSQGCAAESYSEAGWAVSSVLARKVAAPGCELPALAGQAGAGLAACANEIPLPLRARMDRAPAASQAAVIAGRTR